MSKGFPRILLAIWVIALGLRILVFDDGGTLGAYAAIGLFWIITAVLLGLSIARLLKREGGDTFECMLILTALLAFIYRVVIDEGPTTAPVSLLFFLCMIALIVVYIREWWKGKIGKGQGAATSLYG